MSDSYTRSRRISTLYIGESIRFGGSPYDTGSVVKIDVKEVTVQRPYMHVVQIGSCPIAYIGNEFVRLPIDHSTPVDVYVCSAPNALQFYDKAEADNNVRELEHRTGLGYRVDTDNEGKRPVYWVMRHRDRDTA